MSLREVEGDPLAAVVLADMLILLEEEEEEMAVLEPEAEPLWGDGAASAGPLSVDMSMYRT